MAEKGPPIAQQPLPGMKKIHFILIYKRDLAQSEDVQLLLINSNAAVRHASRKYALSYVIVLTYETKIFW